MQELDAYLVNGVGWVGGDIVRIQFRLERE